MKKFVIALGMLMASGVAQVPQIAVTVGSKIINFNRLPKSTVTFGFSAGTVDASGNATLAVSISTSRMPPAALQFDVLYPASVTSISATAGPAATAASKAISCALVSPGDTRCVISATNQTLIANGVVANIAIVINATSTLTLSNVVASTVAGTGLNTAISQATANVAIALALQNVQCAVPPWDASASLPAGTYNLEPSESTACTATLNQAAPTGGYTGAVSASAAGLTFPASVAVPAGQ